MEAEILKVECPGAGPRVVLTLQHASGSPSELDKTQIPGPTARVLERVGLGNSLKSSISSKFLGDVAAAGAGSTL